MSSIILNANAPLFSTEVIGMQVNVSLGWIYAMDEYLDITSTGLFFLLPAYRER